MAAGSNSMNKLPEYILNITLNIKLRGPFRTSWSKNYYDIQIQNYLIWEDVHMIPFHIRYYCNIRRQPKETAIVFISLKKKMINGSQIYNLISHNNSTSAICKFEIEYLQNKVRTAAWNNIPSWKLKGMMYIVLYNLIDETKYSIKTYAFK